ncbi:hypothetical protein SEUCBS139899_010373 [Sporothrix eucalyptigena]|uniref:FAD dependent oxidoreductase n=1 Tax=Sporothrix eucalyptigena TaxID=1812306 RepID=A0ABP0D167_9PEZI
MPDLNSVPPSPRVLAASRQSSSTNVAGIAAAAANNGTSPSATSASASGTQMPPPPVPTSPSSIHVFPSNQMAVNQGSAVSSSALPSPFFPPPLSLASGGVAPATQRGDGPAVDPGPGPLRHPRPLTAAELHMQLEKEQEAVVNRLTRELTLLRAQNASVVSNASSTSASGMSDAATGASSAPSAPPPADNSLFSGTSGFSIPPTTGRHNRTYSNTSTRSQTAAAGSTPSVVGITAPAPIRPTAPNLSRQNSTASRRSRANSPGPSSSVSHSYTHSHINEAAAAGYFHRPGASGAVTPSVSEMSPAIVPGTARYEDAAFYRAELESVKRENEALRRRIRELERAAAATASASASGAPPSSQQSASASTPHHHHSHHGHHHHHASSAQRERRERRSSDVSRGRSESVSTTASMSVQTPGSVPAVSSSASLSALMGSGATTSAPAVASSPSAVSSTPVTGGGGGAGIAGRRESGRERVTSMLSVAGSVAGSVGVGVPEDEVRVGESAASAGLRGQDSGTGGNTCGN